MTAAALLAALSRQALAIDQARTLPAGRGRASFIYGRSASVSDAFNGDGSGQHKLGEPFKVQLDSAMLKKLRPGTDGAEGLIRYLNGLPGHYNENERNNGYYGLTTNEHDPRLGDALYAGTVVPEVTASKEQYNLLTTYGVTDQLSVAFLVPLVRTHVESRFQIVGRNNADDIARAVGGTDPGALAEVTDGLDKVRAVSAETAQSALEAKGYQRFGNTDTTGIGDLLAAARYNYLNRVGYGGQWINSFQSNVSAPTGGLKRANQLDGIDRGLGAWTLEAGHVVNFAPLSNVVFWQGLHYNHRFAASRTMRVPLNADDGLPGPESEENVSMKLGDQQMITAGGRYLPDWLLRDLHLDLGYQWSWKQADRFAGTRGRDYDQLSARTDEYVEMVQLGTGFSTVNRFLSGALPVPADFEINAYIPTRGRNAAVAPYGTLEMSVFF